MTWHHQVNLLRSRDLILNLYFIDQLFSALHRLFCKIGNLRDVDLKFSGSLCDVNIDNPVKFCQVSMSENCISNIGFFRILVCNLQRRQFVSKILYIYLYIQRSGKDFIVIPFVLSDLLGVCLHPQDAIKLSEKADAINHNDSLWPWRYKQIIAHVFKAIVWHLSSLSKSSIL